MSTTTDHTPDLDHVARDAPAEVDAPDEARPLSSLRVLLRLMGNQPVRYPVSALLWIFIWVQFVPLAMIVERFFGGLEGAPGGWATRTVLLALLGWLVVRVVAILVGMRFHCRVLFRASASLGRNMLRWIFGRPGARPVREAPGEVVSRFRDDIEHAHEALDFTVDFLGAVVSSLVSFAIMAAIDPVLAVVAFLPMAIVLLAVWALSARIRRYRIAARDATEAVTGFLGEAFGAAQAVKVAGAEDAVLGRFAVLNERRREMMVRDRTLSAATDTLGTSTGTVGMGLVLVLAAGTMDAPGGLGVEEFALFSILLGHISFAAFMVGIYLARVRQAGVSFERMVALMEGGTWHDLAEHSVLEHALPVPDARLDGTTRDDAPLLSVRGLTHLHPDGDHGVRDVDLDVRPGQLIVVTGRVGSGKTTLLQTALGLLPADRGEVAWRGVPVDDPGRVLVPPLAAYTPQVPRLFSMALRQNLLLGLEADDDALWRAIDAATMAADLDDMPDGLSTMVGPRGMRLSGGQVQRSAAARMLVRRPELVVFDDLSSALDVETEALLWDRLFPDEGGDDGHTTTALVVSHRRPALQRADLVLVLADGRVVDRGTAEELLDRSPEFRRLWG